MAVQALEAMISTGSLTTAEGAKTAKLLIDVLLTCECSTQNNATVGINSSDCYGITIQCNGCEAPMNICTGLVFQALELAMKSK
jgi:hypothetical protein